MKPSSNFQLIRQPASSSSRQPQPPQPTQTQKSKWQIVPITKFQGNIQQALQFYSNQISKLSYQNNILNKQLRNSLQQKKELADAIANYKQQQKQQPDENKKRIRRCANEIQRNFICPVPGCNKSYGAQGSMAQHMKFKHPQFKGQIFPQVKRQGQNLKKQRKFAQD